MRTRPTAVFMSFGTKGDVYPVAAIASAFATDQRHYDVVFVTHSAHQSLSLHLRAKGISCFPVSSPPVLSFQEDNDSTGCTPESFSLQKMEMKRKHRQECLVVAENIFGEGPPMDGDFIVINFFALEGWSLAELFQVHCIVAAPYVVPYSAPSSFERQFQKENAFLYQYLQEAPPGKIGWADIIHWMWPLFSEDWGTWRSNELQLSFLPFTDPVTGLPTWHERTSSPMLLYGFSKEVVECPGYWPSAVRVCGFWFLPDEWQFSCTKCAEISSFISAQKLNVEDGLCSSHVKLKSFLEQPAEQPIVISLSSIGMGYLRNPEAFLRVLGKVVITTSYRFILFSAGYGPLDAAIRKFSDISSPASEETKSTEDQSYLFDARLLCFSGSVPYKWIFPRCAAAIHHGGSGTTAAALYAGIPQIVCPFILDQHYWAERMFWLGVSPEPLKHTCLIPEADDDASVLKAAADMLMGAINLALSTEVKLQACNIAKRISNEVGVSEALQLIKEEIERVVTTS